MKPVTERIEHRIAEALLIKESMANLAARLRLIEVEVDRCFPGNDQVEHVSTPFGTVHRIVEEDVYLDPDKVAEVMGNLASQFPEYFKASFTWRPTPKLLEKAGDASSILGRYIRDFLVYERRRHFDFSPGSQVIDIPAEGKP